MEARGALGVHLKKMRKLTQISGSLATLEAQDKLCEYISSVLHLIHHEGMDVPNELTPTGKQAPLGDLRRLNSHGAEYWSARDLQTLLG